MAQFKIQSHLLIVESCESKSTAEPPTNIEIITSKCEKPSKNPKNDDNSSPKSHEIIQREKLVICNNYASMPTVICKGEGVFLYDVDGNKYFDFLSGFSSVNQGHCHPKIIEAIVKQVSVLHHTSRAFHSDLLVEYAEYVTKLFGYEAMLPMNTGVEAAESSVKIARKWGYKVKKIPANEAKIIFCENNFWGRSIAAVSASTDPSAYDNYGPFVPGFINIPYNNIERLEAELKDPNICAFMTEPIQGDAGAIVPSDGYLKKVRELCTKYNVLYIDDEIQAGLGRTGKRLCVDHENVRPDIVVLGKSLGGGVYPVSAVLADRHIMDVIEPGTHGSTYSGNPLAAKVAMAALKVIEEEKLAENAKKMGQIFRKGLSELDRGVVDLYRGKGLMNAIVLNRHVDAFDFCLKLKKYGLLTRPSHGNILRLAPPLIINEEQIKKSVEIIKKSVEEVRTDLDKILVRSVL